MVGFFHGIGNLVTQAPGAILAMPKTMSATVEAIVGAAYLDGGMDAVEKIVKKLGIDVCENAAQA